jgi:hypothetical protein
MTVQTFRTKPVEVQAIQWTGTNAQAVTDFAGARFAVIPPENRDTLLCATAELWVDGRGGYTPLVEGDWVVRDRSGRLLAVEAKAFPLEYGAVA